MSVKRTFCGKRAINGDLRACGFLQQFLRPTKCYVGIFELRLGLCDRALLGLDIGLKGRALKFVEEISGLNVCALGKQPFVHKGGYACHHVDALGCLNATVDFRAFRHRALLCGNYADSRRRSGLTHCRRSQQKR